MLLLPPVEAEIAEAETDEDPDAFFQHLYKLRERLGEIGGGISDRILMDILLDMPIPDYQIARFNYPRGTESFGPDKAELAICVKRGCEQFNRNYKSENPLGCRHQPGPRACQHHQENAVELADEQGMEKPLAGRSTDDLEGGEWTRRQGRTGAKRDGVSSTTPQAMICPSAKENTKTATLAHKDRPSSQWTRIESYIKRMKRRKPAGRHWRQLLGPHKLDKPTAAGLRTGDRSSQRTRIVGNGEKPSRQQ